MAINFSSVRQIGFVVKDFDATVKYWEHFLGRAPDRFSMTPDGEKLYYGETENFCAKIAIFKLDNTDIEIITPIRGRSIWQDFLDKTGGGIHHIQFACDSFAEDNKYLTENEGELLQLGPSVRGDGYHFAYYDTADKLGCYAEILNSLEVFDH